LDLIIWELLKSYLPIFLFFNSSFSDFMNILVVGVNTRPIVNSAKRLGHTVYSASHYNPMDLNADVKKYIVDDNKHGYFHDAYDEKKLLNIAEHLIDNYNIDHIFTASGIFENINSKTPDWNVVGNTPKKIKTMSNKYIVSKKLENLGYDIPATYIAYNSKQIGKYLYTLNSIIIKTVYGSGGTGVYSLSLGDINCDINDAIDGLNIQYPVIVQEKIFSDSYSASFVGSNFLCFNKQLINNNSYVGNITPYNINNIDNVNNYIDLFEEIISSFDLSGMNGIDFMIKDNVPVIIEINPRILGTFETIELSSNKNLIDLIIKYQGVNKRSSDKLHKIVRKNNQYVKKILFAEQKLISYIGVSNLQSQFCNANITKPVLQSCKFSKGKFGDIRICDIPKYGAIIEKNEPLATIIINKASAINDTTINNNISKMVVNYEYDKRRYI